jgi:CRP-like cAMP-binding protein
MWAAEHPLHHLTGPVVATTEEIQGVTPLASPLPAVGHVREVEHVTNAEASLTLTVADWKRLLKTGTLLTFHEGQSICKKGDVLPGIFQICHGVVHVKIEVPVIENETLVATIEDAKVMSPTNKTPLKKAIVKSKSNALPPKPQPPKMSLQTIAVLATNDIFGEMSFFDGRTASADLAAGDGGTTVLKLESRKLVDMMASDLVLQRKFFYFLLVILCNRLRTVTKQVALQRQSRTLASNNDKVLICVCSCATTYA